MFNRSILFSLLLMASCSKSGGDSNAQGDMLRPTQEEGAAGAPVTSSCPPGEEAWGLHPTGWRGGPAPTASVPW